MRRPALLLLALAACSQRGASGETTASAQPSGQGQRSSVGSKPSPSPSTTASASPPTCEPGCGAVERCEAGSCKPACPEGEVYVPATGPDGFSLGHGKEDMSKPHQVVLTKPFCIDATEVTVAAYERCVEAGKCEEPRTWGLWINYPKQPKHPVNKVHWNHAKTYCAFNGQSLPTEAQWVWAATGGDGRKYAWGNDEPTCEHADFAPGEITAPSGDDGCHGGGTSEVGSHPKGDRVTEHGRIHDLSGNVWEWVLDNFVPFNAEPATDPLVLTAENGTHVVRGGGWNRSGRGIRVDFRGGAAVDYQVPGLGFRCVRNALAAPAEKPTQE